MGAQRGGTTRRCAALRNRGRVALVAVIATPLIAGAAAAAAVTTAIHPAKHFAPTGQAAVAKHFAATLAGAGWSAPVIKPGKPGPDGAGWS